MKRYRMTIEGRPFDVKVLGDPRQEQVEVEVDGERFTVGVAAVSPATEPAPIATTVPVVDTAESLEEMVAAPLPGVIKSIAVRVGQHVTPNDSLFVIEAMKMDNVIRARRKGTVGDILVTEGRQVAYGDPLLEFQD